MTGSNRQELLDAYQALRSGCIKLELLCADATTLITQDDQKRLDKAVTVMKVGFKIIKRVLRKNGVTGCLKHTANDADEAHP